jgi:tRNA A-37 threonylcarbamoyl transferase component Bud32
MSAQPLARPVELGGRYTLLELIAVGGMAEIYRARQSAMAGFEKVVVVKRLRPELVADQRMVDMFLDEARISALLNHPNIVHVHDVGEHDGAPFIAMELIEGEELTQLCRRGLAHGKFLPLAHAVDLVRQAARGLGYFHAKRSADGTPLAIVHRDISPTNLLVTEDGTLKIIDFGIASAANQRYQDVGAMPGKLSYMSPEQASRDRLDHRSDVFSLGVVLYEITVGKRLFKGRAQDVIDRLKRGDIKPPTFVRNDYPGALESIVMRALELHPEDRYDSGYDMAEELYEFLREAQLRSGPLRIARYLDELAAAAGRERRPEIMLEAERRAGDDEELDFERGMFDAFQARVGGSEAAAAEWDEYQEEETEVAAALGVDVSLLDAGGTIGDAPIGVSTLGAPTAEERATVATARSQARAPSSPPAPRPGSARGASAAVAGAPAAASAPTAPAAAIGSPVLLWLALAWAAVATIAAAIGFAS